MIYLCRNKRNGYVKIGFSHFPTFREKTLQSEEPDIAFEYMFPGKSSDERDLHRRYAHRRLRGEWFELTPSDIQEICEHFGVLTRAEKEELKAELYRRVSKFVESIPHGEGQEWMELTCQPEDKLFLFTSTGLAGRDYETREVIEKAIKAKVIAALEPEDVEF